MAPPHTSQGLTWVPRAVAAVAARPSLWATAVRQVATLAAPGWWRRPPFLPLPSPSYLRFRLVTAYGDPEAVPAAVDLVTYLGWCRQERRRRPQRERSGGAGTGRLRAMAGR